MSKPDYTGNYKLVSAENQEEFMKAQGISWVNRKAVGKGAKEIKFEHSGDDLKMTIIGFIHHHQP